jgi:hypothetical protein
MCEGFVLFAYIFLKLERPNCQEGEGSDLFHGLNRTTILFFFPFQYATYRGICEFYKLKCTMVVDMGGIVSLFFSLLSCLYFS